MLAQVEDRRRLLQPHLLDQQLRRYLVPVRLKMTFPFVVCIWSIPMLGALGRSPIGQFAELQPPQQHPHRPDRR